MRVGLISGIGRPEIAVIKVRRRGRERDRTVGIWRSVIIAVDLDGHRFAEIGGTNEMPYEIGSILHRRSALRAKDRIEESLSRWVGVNEIDVGGLRQSGKNQQRPNGEER